MRKYHLSCGDSTRGSIGICGTVLAPSKKQALHRFRRALEDATGVFGEIAIERRISGIEYVNVYITPGNIEIEEISLEDNWSTWFP